MDYLKGKLALSGAILSWKSCQQHPETHRQVISDVSDVSDVIVKVRAVASGAEIKIIQGEIWQMI